MLVKGRQRRGKTSWEKGREGFPGALIGDVGVEELDLMDVGTYVDFSSCSSFGNGGQK